MPVRATYTFLLLDVWTGCGANPRLYLTFTGVLSRGVTLTTDLLLQRLRMSGDMCLHGLDKEDFTYLKQKSR
jgi:hypothetical protein